MKAPKGQHVIPISQMGKLRPRQGKAMPDTSQLLSGRAGLGF